MDDPDTAARLRVRTLTVKVSDASEDLLDSGGVVADDVGGFGHVVTIPADRKPQQTVKIRVVHISSAECLQNPELRVFATLCWEKR